MAPEAADTASATAASERSLDEESIRSKPRDNDSIRSGPSGRSEQSDTLRLNKRATSHKVLRLALARMPSVGSSMTSRPTKAISPRKGAKALGGRSRRGSACASEMDEKSRPERIVSSRSNGLRTEKHDEIRITEGDETRETKAGNTNEEKEEGAGWFDLSAVTNLLGSLKAQFTSRESLIPDLRLGSVRRLRRGSAEEKQRRGSQTRARRGSGVADHGPLANSHQPPATSHQPSATSHKP